MIRKILIGIGVLLAVVLATAAFSFVRARSAPAPFVVANFTDLEQAGKIEQIGETGRGVKYRLK